MTPWRRGRYGPSKSTDWPTAPSSVRSHYRNYRSRARLRNPVDSRRTIRPVTTRDSAYYTLSNQSEVGMTPKARNLVLTKSQAACLVALRHRKDSKPKIAIHAKLDMIKTAVALATLARLRLAKQDQTKKWHATAHGK